MQSFVDMIAQVVVMWYMYIKELLLVYMYSSFGCSIWLSPFSLIVSFLLGTMVLYILVGHNKSV